MAIQLTTEIDDTGFEGNYWKLENMTITRGKVSSEDVISGTFKLYKSAADYPTKRRAGLSSTVQITGDIVGSTTVAQIITQLENKIIEAGEALEGGTKVA